MKVAVIGSGGFIGRHLVKALADEGLSVVPISSQHGAGIDPDTGLVPGNLQLNDANAVVYLSQSPYRHGTSEAIGHMLRINVLAAVEIAELARRCGAQRLIYASTGNVYLPSFLPLAEGDAEAGQDWYTLTKLQAEQALGLFREYFDIHILRLFGVYGPKQKDRLIPNLFQSIFAGRPIYLAQNPNDPQDSSGLKISLSYIDDVVHAIIQMCRRGGPPLLNVAGNEAISIKAAAEAIGEAIGNTPVFEQASKPRDRDLIADVTLFNEWMSTPCTPFAAGLRKTVDYLLTN